MRRKGYTNWWKNIINVWETSLIARFMGPTWGPSGADRTQVGRMLTPWTLLSGMVGIMMAFCHSLFFNWELGRTVYIIRKLNNCSQCKGCYIHPHSSIGWWTLYITLWDVNTPWKENSRIDQHTSVESTEHYDTSCHSSVPVDTWHNNNIIMCPLE